MIKQYHPSLPHVSEVTELFSFWPNYTSLWPEFDEVDRICLDRLLLIRERLLDLGLTDHSILDLGGGSGYFSWMLYITTASAVDMVEDERARQFGYDEASFAAELRSRIAEFKLENLHIHNTSIEEFLSKHDGHSYWDITLCFSVLHHFLTGYGDNRSVGQIDYEELLGIFRRIGSVTIHYLFIEIDPERIPNYEAFISDLMEEGKFKSMKILGKSSSSIGVTRNIIEFHKL